MLQRYLCLSTQMIQTDWLSVPGKKRGHIQMKEIWGKSNEKDFAEVCPGSGVTTGMVQLSRLWHWGWWGEGRKQLWETWARSAQQELWSPRREPPTPALWPHSPPSRPHPPELAEANTRAPVAHWCAPQSSASGDSEQDEGGVANGSGGGRGRHSAQKPSKAVSPGRMPSYCICFSRFICGVFVCIYTDPWKSHFFITENLT